MEMQQMEYQTCGYWRQHCRNRQGMRSRWLERAQCRHGWTPFPSLRSSRVSNLSFQDQRKKSPCQVQPSRPSECYMTPSAEVSKRNKPRCTEFKTSIAQMLEEVDRMHEEKERLKMELAGEDALRSKLKKELEIKCLSVQTSRFSQKAISTEMEALSLSVDNTLRQEKHMKVDHEMIALSHEEYNELYRKAKEETKTANSQFRVSEEKRMAMEQRKFKALRKLETLQREKQQREKGIRGGMSEDSFKAAADVDKENVYLEDMRKLHLAADMDAETKATPLHRKLKETGGYSRRSKRRQRRQRKEKKVRKKQSILKRTKIFFMRLFK